MTRSATILSKRRALQPTGQITSLRGCRFDDEETRRDG